MKFLVDAQLPPALVRFVRSTGHDCDHVGDISLLDADDGPIWQLATDQEYVIISKDEDFALLKLLHPSGPRVVWLRVGLLERRPRPMVSAAMAKRA